MWSLAVSKGGAFMVSGSHDRSIRIWDQTQEQVFLEEEREKELEDAFEADLEQESVPDGVGVDAKSKVTTTTAANLKDAERLAEAIDLAEAAVNAVYAAALRSTDRMVMLPLRSRTTTCVHPPRLAGHFRR